MVMIRKAVGAEKTGTSWYFQAMFYPPRKVLLNSVAVLLCLVLAGCVIEEVLTETSWHLVHGNVTPYPCGDRAVCFDELRQRLVVIGGTELPDLWEYDGHQWFEGESEFEVGPILSRPAVCFHSGLGLTVYYGGMGASSYSLSLWGYDGQTWRDISPGSFAQYRSNAAMAYDSDRQCLVLFGGYFSTTLRDTWEWHDGEWRKITTANKPPRRQGHAMIYDPKNRRTLLFGGRDRSTIFNDTWSYDGLDWTQINSTTKPTRRYDCSLTYDRFAEVPLLFGGHLASDAYSHDLWRLDGSEWHLVNDLSGENSRLAYPTLWQDAAGTHRVFCSDSGYRGISYAIVYRIVGPALLEEKPPEVPIPTWNGVMTYDRAGKRLIYISPADRNGSGATWQYRSGVWQDLSIDLPSSIEFSLTDSDTFFCEFDRRLQSVLLVPDQGDYSGDGFVVFSLEASQWQLREFAGRPLATTRFSHAYDTDRQVLVIFGGAYSVSYSQLDATDETWEYDGQELRRIHTHCSPSPRYNASMAYDEAGRRCILFGGHESGMHGDGVSRETWEYVEREWRLVQTVNAPIQTGPMVYHPQLRKIILCEGMAMNERYRGGDLEMMAFWVFDGTEWYAMPELEQIPTRYNPALTWDADDAALYLLGGAYPCPLETFALQDFWKWELP